MNWQILIALLLLPVLVYSDCESFADFVDEVRNGGVAPYEGKLNYRIKSKISKVNPRTGAIEVVSITMEDIEYFFKKWAKGEFNVSKEFYLDGRIEDELRKISKEMFLHLIEMAIAKTESTVFFNVPPGTHMRVYQVRIVCDGYQMSLPHTIKTYYKYPPVPLLSD